MFFYGEIKLFLADSHWKNCSIHKKLMLVQKVAVGSKSKSHFDIENNRNICVYSPLTISSRKQSEKETTNKTTAATGANWSTA